MYHTRVHSTKKNTNHIEISALGSGRQIQEMRIKEINKESIDLTFYLTKYHQLT